MTSHKEKLITLNKKDFHLPKDYYQNSQNGLSHSHLANNNEKAPIQERYGRFNSNNDNQEQLDSQLNFSANNKATADNNNNKKSQPSLRSSKGARNDNNRGRRVLSMYDTRAPPYNNVIYKSQSLNAIKSKEPSKILSKSTIQQEYHDMSVQRHLTGISYGKSRKPCLIATGMFFLFGLVFIIGLTLICLTYIYKNISFSLDKGEMLGPLILAGSFLFLSVGIKFLYNAHKISRKERRSIAYQGYDIRYVGLKHGNRGDPKEKLVSGTGTDVRLTRIPNKKQVRINTERTLGKSSQNVGHQSNMGSEL